MKSLIIGNRGQVGWELERLLNGTGQTVAVDYPEIDLTDDEGLKRLIFTVKPRIIFNAGAYTAVDKAESEPNRARAINAIGPRTLAMLAKEIGAGLVHYSTDYVYDGQKSGEYLETDRPNAASVYGRSKAEGDAFIREIGGAYVILRTSWVYGSRGSNFLLTMLRLGNERSELRIVNDQFGSPTWCRSIAQTSVVLAEQMIAGDIESGIFHTTNTGSTTWYGFAQEIFHCREKRTGKPAPKLIPIRTEEYPVRATRPKNSVLANEKLVRQLGYPLPPWQEALSCVMDELLGKGQH